MCLNQNVIILSVQSGYTQANAKSQYNYNCTIPSVEIVYDLTEYFCYFRLAESRNISNSSENLRPGSEVYILGYAVMTTYWYP